MLDEIQFYLFNHYHCIDAPPDEQRDESIWVNCPDELSDPEGPHALYQRYTRELLLAEDLGFDAIALNEAPPDRVLGERAPRVEDTPGVQEKERSR